MLKVMQPSLSTFPGMEGWLVVWREGGCVREKKGGLKSGVGCTVNAECIIIDPVLTLGKYDESLNSSHADKT